MCTWQTQPITMEAGHLGGTVLMPLCPQLITVFFGDWWGDGASLWLRSLEPTCQCRRHEGCRFNPWEGKTPLEEEMATYSSILAWKNPVDIGAWQATVHGVSKNWTQLSNWACRAIERLSGGGWRPEPLLQLEQLHISLVCYLGVPHKITLKKGLCLFKRMV